MTMLPRSNMIFDGAPAFLGGIDEAVKVTFSKPGLCVYKCLLHYAMGMVGPGQVGPASNEARIDAGFSSSLTRPGKPAQRCKS